MIEVDGSYGEGGGQIVRTVLGLSCLFLKPFRIHNIRKGRKRPGLMPQHLACVRALQLLSGAVATGDSVGSTELTFEPRKMCGGGSFLFDIGTAGSTSLVLQAVIISLLHSGEKTSVTIKGGTHVPFSPSFHYLSDVFAPLLARINIAVHFSIESYGFYPRGGGAVRADIFPVSEIYPLIADQKGKLLRLHGCSGVGNLPRTIAERQKSSLLSLIGRDQGIPCGAEIRLLEVQARGQGTFVFLCAESEHAVAGFASLGARGKKAETVGEEAAGEFLEYSRTGAALDPHVSDQIIPFLSLGTGGSVFTTSRVTRHLMTSLWAVSLFHNFSYAVEGEIGKPGRVEISPGTITSR